ncbi:uncharacterized protein LOC127022995 [Gymnogyps californianus]|uniref:uncharacterized protein LOC127022995 n=1 Tax=Gymnogyps californianus TaxID=33616 RepID=UPI0021CA570C|nr:uncharacterized protein LOC127022995 [Gymnogyps californianus]
MTVQGLPSTLTPSLSCVGSCHLGTCCLAGLVPLLLAVLAHSSGSLVQAAVTQPPSVSANPGQTVQITCSGLSSSSSVGWFQQKVPGSAPVTVIYYNDKRPSGIPSRFSGSLSGSTGTLTITGVQAEDEGSGFLSVIKAFGHRGPVLLPREGCGRGALADPHLLPSLLSIPGSLVQAALTQPPSVSENPGQTVQITCSGLDSSNAVGWFQQKVPGSAPVTVIYKSNQRPSDIPSRFSGSSSGSTGTLTITGVQAEDEAVYFCGGWESSSAGQGHGDAEAGPTQPPSMFPGPGSGDSAGLGVSEAGTNRPDHLLWSSYSYGWYQQKVPGGALVTVIYENSKRPSGIPSRFSGSASGTTATLTITGVQAEDEAVYYCGAQDSSADQHPGALQGGHDWVLCVDHYCLLCGSGSDPDSGAGGYGSGTAPASADLCFEAPSLRVVPVPSKSQFSALQFSCGA